MNLAELKKPFPPERISWRVGSVTQDKSKGMALAYIDARDVMGRLDEVCGPENWECRYPHAGAKTVCEIGIYVKDRWVVKADGAGDSDVEAEKGALSDAFKRAAVKWGIGQYLYDLDSPWVALDDKKRITPAEYKRLEALLAKDAKSAPTQRDAIHNSPTMARDPDIEEGVKNWCLKEKNKIALCSRLPDLLMWKDEREAELHRLFKKAPEHHKDLMAFYQNVFTDLSKKETP